MGVVARPAGANWHNFGLRVVRSSRGQRLHAGADTTRQVEKNRPASRSEPRGLRRVVVTLVVEACSHPKKKAPLARRRNGAFRRGKKPGTSYLLSAASGTILSRYRPPLCCQAKRFSLTPFTIDRKHPNPLIRQHYILRISRPLGARHQLFYRTDSRFQHLENPHASQATQPSLNRKGFWQSGQITLYCVCCH